VINVKVNLKLVKSPMENGAVEMEDDSTVKDLIRRLCNGGGKKLRKMLIDPRTNEIYSYYLVLVSGLSVRSLEDGMETKLKDNDEVAIIRLLLGG
jgi:molybdopterin converting factor small subunit